MSLREKREPGDLDALLQKSQQPGQLESGEWRSLVLYFRNRLFEAEMRRRTHDDGSDACFQIVHQMTQVFGNHPEAEAFYKSRGYRTYPNLQAGNLACSPEEVLEEIRNGTDLGIFWVQDIHRMIEDQIPIPQEVYEIIRHLSDLVKADWKKVNMVIAPEMKEGDGGIGVRMHILLLRLSSSLPLLLEVVRKGSVNSIQEIIKSCIDLKRIFLKYRNESFFKSVVDRISVELFPAIKKALDEDASGDEPSQKALSQLLSELEHIASEILMTS